jgi:hypothetical protein
MPNLSRGIMLEGTSCAGKTSTMYAIKRLFASDLSLERNIIMLGEHYTQVLNSINGELKYHEQREHTEMLFNRVSMLEQLYDWACLLGDFRRTSRGLYTVFERGLINHIAYYQDFASPEIIELGERFAKLGIGAVLLVVPGGHMEERVKLREEEMKVHHSESHRRELAEQLEKQQDNLLAAIKKTNMPSRIIYTDSMDWDGYAKSIVADTE